MKRLAGLIVSAVIAVTVLIGCATPPVRPTQDQINNADYGPYPDNYEQIIKDQYTKTLFDPYTAVYTFKGSPTKAWFSRYGQVMYGWAICGTINAKNRMGGYVGAQPFYFLFHKGNVVQKIDYPEVTALGLCLN